jgi:hypothetical protein
MRFKGVYFNPEQTRVFKEFIKELKEEIRKAIYGDITPIDLMDKLNKLAGEKLK